ncbi:hypothetical protein PAPYR_3277 [Paratrimastix pyriformis]|uniref:F-box domain-containing protein n=1 Tax=Paratrimastix pyriformis TaxID=342808 RepID=A0ABQ8UN70_9EUKA|nr:hypothetical protein PAPYR_3277 [Paratrimastix pyriformis]
MTLHITNQDALSSSTFSFFENLPIELLAHVFCSLQAPVEFQTCRNISRRFRHVASVQWHTLRVGRENPTHILELLARLSLSLRGLIFTSAEGLSDGPLMSFLPEYGKALEVFAAPASDLTDLSVEVLAHSCPRLTRVDLSRSGRITDKGLEALLLHSAVEDLGLSFCRAVLGPGFGALARRGSTHPLRRLGFGAPSFKRDLLDRPRFTEESFAMLARYCPRLASLDVHGRVLGDGAGLRSLRELELLELLLESCTLTSLVPLGDLLSEQGGLRTLAMADTVPQLAEGPLVAGLGLGRCPLRVFRPPGSFTDGGLEQLLAGCPASLTELDLSATQCRAEWSCGALWAHCLALRRLVMPPLLSQASVEALLHEPPPFLEILTLRTYGDLADEGLGPLFARGLFLRLAELTVQAARATHRILEPLHSRAHFAAHFPALRSLVFLPGSSWASPATLRPLLDATTTTAPAAPAPAAPGKRRGPSLTFFYTPCQPAQELAPLLAQYGVSVPPAWA